MSWRHFFLFKLPLSVLLLLGLAEVLALALSTTPQLRHPLDRLVASLPFETRDAEIVLFGDSVTQDVANQYELAEEGRLADLTTNKASAAMGIYLLLRRHLEHNGPPRHIVYAGTPEMLSYTPRESTSELYLASVFTKSDEQEILALAGLLPTTEFWKPALFKIETSIFNRIIAKLMGPRRLTRTALPAETRTPPQEGAAGSSAPVSKIGERINARLELSRNAQLAIARICVLSAAHDFQFHFVWAPLPAHAHKRWQSDKRLKSLETAIAEITGTDCQNVTFTDINETHAFPNHAFRDADHLRRPGWTTFYGRILRDYLSQLPTR